MNDTQETYTIFTDVHSGRYGGAARIKGDSMQPEYPNFSIVTFVTTGFDRDGIIVHFRSEVDQAAALMLANKFSRDADSFRCPSHSAFRSSIPRILSR